MEQKTAAGLIIYRLQQTPEFLLINDTFASRRHWTPPKGNIVNGEDSLKTALREANELTGLSSRDLRVEPKFTKTIRYLSDSQPKTVVYHLAQISDHGRVVPSSESLHYGWFNPTIAQEKLLYRNIQEVITAAVEFINVAVAAREVEREREEREREEREREQREREQRQREREREQRDRRAVEQAQFDRGQQWAPPGPGGVGAGNYRGRPYESGSGSTGPATAGRRPSDTSRPAPVAGGRPPPDAVRGGYDGGDRGGSYDGNRGGPYDGNRGGPYDGNRGGPYDGNRGGPYDGSRGGPYDGNRGGPYDGNRGGPYDGNRGGPYDGNRGGPYDGNRGGPYDGNRGGPYDGNRGGPYDGSRGGPYNSNRAGPPNDGNYGRAPYDGGRAPLPYDGARGDAPYDGGRDRPPYEGGRGGAPYDGGRDRPPYDGARGGGRPYPGDDRRPGPPNDANRGYSQGYGRDDREQGNPPDGPRPQGRPTIGDPASYKTRLCERFDREGQCPYGDRCVYAHGQKELRTPGATSPVDAPPNVGPGAGQRPLHGSANPLYKTKLCERFMNDGNCTYGDRCHFAHGEEELRVRPTDGPGGPGGRYEERNDGGRPRPPPGGPSDSGRYPQGREDDYRPYGPDGGNDGYGGGRGGYYQQGPPVGGRYDAPYDDYNRPRGPPMRYGPNGPVPAGILGPAPQYLGSLGRPPPPRGYPPSAGPTGPYGPGPGVPFYAPHGPGADGPVPPPGPVRGGRPFWSNDDNQRRPTPWDVGTEQPREPRATRPPSTTADDKVDDRFTPTGEPVRKPGAYRPPAAKQREAEVQKTPLASMKDVERALPETRPTAANANANAGTGAGNTASSSARPNAAAPAASSAVNGNGANAASGKASSAPAAKEVVVVKGHRGGGGRNARDAEVSYVLEREEVRTPAVASTGAVDRATVLRQYKGSLEESLEGELRAFFASGKSLGDEVREVQRREVRHDLTKQQLFNVLVPALFYGDNLTGALEARKPFLSKFILSQSDQVAFLRAWERYYAREEEALQSHALLLAKKLYDLDLVDEDAFLTWDDPQSSSAFKTRVRPFLGWLREAEEQSD